jgi:hypothetical protein
MKDALNERLSQLLVDLDVAIAQAVENPLLLVEGPLQDIESTCAALAALEKTKPAGGSQEEFVEREKLLWQVRARSGRLQLLMDSAAQFYSSCFSCCRTEGLAYGVQGEWSAVGNASHLVLDC